MLLGWALVRLRDLSRRGQHAKRLFSTARLGNGITMAYDLHEPPKGKDAGPANAPIVFIHGLLGSKQNNRGMSK